MGISALTFHAPVSTPRGPGIVQGRLVKRGEPDRVLVSHKPAAYLGELRDKPGIWVLRDYAAEEVKVR